MPGPTGYKRRLRRHSSRPPETRGPRAWAGSDWRFSPPGSRLRRSPRLWDRSVLRCSTPGRGAGSSIDSVPRHLRCPPEERVVVWPVGAFTFGDQLGVGERGREGLAAEAGRAFDGRSKTRVSLFRDHCHPGSQRGAGHVSRLERVSVAGEAPAGHVRTDAPGCACDDDRAVGEGCRCRAGAGGVSAPGRWPRRRRVRSCRRARALRRLSCG